MVGEWSGQTHVILELLVEVRLRKQVKYAQLLRVDNLEICTQHAQEIPSFKTIFQWNVLITLLLGQDYLNFCHWEVRLLIARLELTHNLDSLARILLLSIVSRVSYNNIVFFAGGTFFFKLVAWPRYNHHKFVPPNPVYTRTEHSWILFRRAFDTKLSRFSDMAKYDAILTSNHQLATLNSLAQGIDISSLFNLKRMSNSHSVVIFDMQYVKESLYLSDNQHIWSHKNHWCDIGLLNLKLTDFLKIFHLIDQDQSSVTRQRHPHQSLWNSQIIDRKPVLVF